MNKQNLNNSTKPKKVNLIKLAADVHKKDFKICRQIGDQNIQCAQTFTPKDAFDWAVKQKELSHRVVFCHEAGFSGFSLARNLKAAGVETIVMCPQQLDERKKKVNTDKRDARAIGSRLDRYLAGNTEALVPVRIPTILEEDQRAESRQELQMMQARKRFEAQGRSLLHFKGLECPVGWWRGDDKIWALKIKRYGWNSEVVKRLEIYRRMAMAADAEVKLLSKTIEEDAPNHLPKHMSKAPVGFGAYTTELLRREVCDWSRFKNRRNVGAFAGLVCSENSSGDTQQKGSITKTGNPRFRYLLLELAWRIFRFQPRYWVTQKFNERYNKSKPRSVARKKIVVAAARLIAIDLWRLYTDQTTGEKLGLAMDVPVPAITIEESVNMIKTFREKYQARLAK